MEKLDKIAKVGNWVAAFLLGNTRELIARIDERTSRLIKDMDEMKPKVDSMSPKVDVLWQRGFSFSNSPRQLNDVGQKILGDSGIKAIVDGKKDKLLAVVKAKNPNNPYDAERVIIEVMEKLPEYCPEIIDELKNGAFRSGVNVEAILFVGSIYLRNLIFPNLGFNVEDLDKPRGVQTT
jgi:hypothetical protein